MSDIKIEIDKARDLTIHIITGKTSPEEIISTLESFYNNPTKHLLWDFSQADVSGITGDDLKHILSVADKYANRRPQGKTAILATSDLPFGLGRQYSILGNLHESPVHIEPFRSYDMAIKWLLGNN
jgi:hypothetical protein